MNNEALQNANNQIDAKEPYRPLISILVPVYNVAPKILHACIDSVLAQTYPNWQLCMVDDHSTMPEMAQILHAYDDDPRFKLKYRQENGHIARATNDAMEMAEGDFIAFLDCDDVLCENALEVMAHRLAENPELDFLYSDEDKLTEDGTTLCYPFYKPDWSPDYFLNIMYTCHFSLYRRKIAMRIGGIPYGCDGAQDYAFTLAFTEQTTPDRIAHIPQILYHWRLRVGSIAENPEAKPYAQTGVIKAKTDALARRGLKGDVEWIGDNFQYRVNYEWDPWPKVSVIVLSKDHPEVLRRCLTSIREKTEYPDYEIIVVDNGSAPAAKARYEALCAETDAVYVYEKMPFNFSKSCNLGAAKATGELLLFLNDDTEVITPVWMKRMAGQALVPHAGAVGAKLLYPGGTKIQHVGVVSLESGPGHAYGGADDAQVFDYGLNRSDVNVLMVTGACLMVTRARFDEIGGWDERFPETYNDCDFCMRLYEKGYFNCLRNDAVLYHYESFSRGNDAIQPAKKASMQAAWRLLYGLHPQFRGRDPFYNPAYNPVSADYTVRPAVELAGAERVAAQRFLADAGVKEAANANGAASTTAAAEDAGKEANLPVMCHVQNPNLHFALDQGLGGIGIVGPKEVLSLRGWAYLSDAFYLKEDAPAAKTVRASGGGMAGTCPAVGQQQVYVLLLENGTPAYRIPAKMCDRPDVKRAFHLPSAMAGFSVDFSATDLAPGGYGLALGIDCGGVMHWAPLGQAFIYVKDASAELDPAQQKTTPKAYIGVCCHKPSFVPDNPYLVPIHVGAALKDKPLDGMQPDCEGEQISAKNPHYCELTAHYWMWKNKALSADAPEWFGLFHYRRYLSFADARFAADAEAQISEDAPDADTLACYGISKEAMDRVLSSGADIFLPEPYDVRNGDALSIRELYVKNHEAEDLSCMEAAIRDRWPAYVPAMEAYLNGTQSLACSMFVMRRELFAEYSQFLFDVLSVVEEKRQDALLDYSAYNARIYGFLGERLLGIFVLAKQMQEDAPKVRYLQRIQFAFTDAETPAPKPAGGIPVIFSTDETYARYTAAAVASLVASKKPETALDILILHFGLSESKKRLLSETAANARAALGNAAGDVNAADRKKEGAVSLRFYDVSWALRKMRNRGLVMPVTAPMLPALLGELLPSYGRVISLDSDLLVCDDLTDLYNADLGEAAMGGVRNVDVITVHNRYNPPLLAQWQERAHDRSLRRWIQPGVLVMDLPRWKSQVSAEAAFAAFAGFPAGHEMEAVNLLGACAPAVLDDRWNMQQPDNFATLVGPRDGAVAALSVAESASWRAALLRPGILHFSGRDKPWVRTEGVWADRWWKTARTLGCYETLLRDFLSGVPAPGCEGTPIAAWVDDSEMTGASGTGAAGTKGGFPGPAPAPAPTGQTASMKSRMKQELKRVLPQPVIDQLKKLRQ